MRCEDEEAGGACHRMSYSGTVADAPPTATGPHKLQWLSQASVANTINTPVLWAVHIYHCLAMAEDMAYKTSKAFCLSCR